MKVMRTINWTAKSGKQIEVKIEKRKGVADEIAYADGWNVNLGKKTEDSIYVEVFIDGKFTTRDYQAPHIITEQSYFKSYKDLKAKGVHARAGDAYIAEELYNLIMATITEMDAELGTTEEFEEVRAQEVAREAKKEAAYVARAEAYERDIKNGMCPKCGTWCYGDCQAH